MKKALKGLTFIEVIIASSILVIVGFVLFQVFMQGTRLWNRVIVRQGSVDYMIFSERLTHDLQNSFVSDKEKFEGDSDFVEFNTMNVSRGGGREEIYRIRYAYDAGGDSIKRLSWDTKDILNKQPGKTSVALTGIKSCKFQFYGSDKKQAGEWSNRFNKKCIPEAVKVSIEYEQQGNKKTIYRIISLPHGGCIS